MAKQKNDQKQKSKTEQKRDKSQKQKAKRVSVKKILLRTLLGVAICILTVGIAVLAINLYIYGKTKSWIIDLDDQKLEPGGNGAEIDAVVVLGCSVLPGGEPSRMLADRVDAGVEVFKKGGAKALVMSGDRSDYYDEVTAMVNRAVARGVPRECIVEDPEGFSTSESIERAGAVYGYKRIVIVTQRYHLFRSLYIAGKNGLEAYGVAADTGVYEGHVYQELREIAARVKDFFKCM